MKPPAPRDSDPLTRLDFLQLAPKKKVETEKVCFTFCNPLPLPSLDFPTVKVARHHVCSYDSLNTGAVFQVHTSMPLRTII